MAATYFFDTETEGKLQGSSFGKPDGTEHAVEIWEGNGKIILRVELEGSARAIDLVFTNKQAVAFASAAERACSRLGLDLP